MTWIIWGTRHVGNSQFSILNYLSLIHKNISINEILNTLFGKNTKKS